MGLATHLGPWVLGTVKNPSNTSNTVSTSQIGQYRNTGATIALQTSPGGLLFSNTSATTLTTPGNVIWAVGGTSSSTLTLTGTTAAAEGIVSGLTVVGPGIAAGTKVSSVSGSAVTLSAAATTNATSPAPFLFYDATAGYNNNPLVIPAGAFITDIYVDVLTAFNQGTTNVIDIKLANSTSTYTIATLSAGTSLPVGRYVLGAGTSASVGGANNTTFATTAIGAAILGNVSGGQNSPTDCIVQANTSGTGTAATTGMASITVQYAVRNSDGTYFPQTQSSTYNNVAIY